MTTAVPSNPAAHAVAAPLLMPDGFTAGSGFDLVRRSRLPGLVRRYGAGTPAAPSGRTLFALVPRGTEKRSRIVAALKDPATSDLAVFELVPPPTSRTLAALAVLSSSAASALVLYAVLMTMAPTGTKLVSLYYGGAVSGETADRIETVIGEPGVLVMKNDDKEQLPKKKFFVRMKELKEQGR